MNSEVKFECIPANGSEDIALIKVLSDHLGMHFYWSLPKKFEDFPTNTKRIPLILEIPNYHDYASCT